MRYLPAEGDLGGDWYDIFTLPSGKVAFVMGDVEGHGLRAAVAMGRLRSALRAYALDYEDPAEVLRHLDRKLCYFESEISATVVYAVTEPPFDLVTICNAGHPAPLIARRGQPIAEIATVSAGLLLGLDPAEQRHSETIALPAGAALAFYTDGLVERRRRSDQHTDPDVERLDLVRRAFAADDNAETACSRIIARDSVTTASRTTSRWSWCAARRDGLSRARPRGREDDPGTSPVRHPPDRAPHGGPGPTP